MKELNEKQKKIKEEFIQKSNEILDKYPSKPNQLDGGGTGELVKLQKQFFKDMKEAEDGQ